MYNACTKQLMHAETGGVHGIFVHPREEMAPEAKVPFSPEGVQNFSKSYFVIFKHYTVDSRYYELAYYEVPVTTRFFAGPELPHACFNALKY